MLVAKDPFIKNLMIVVVTVFLYRLRAIGHMYIITVGIMVLLLSYAVLSCNNLVTMTSVFVCY